MKKCPFCAENIQDDAVLCRYCTRRVKGRYNRLIFLAVIVVVAASFYLTHKREIDRSMRRFTREICSICRSIGEIARELPAGLKAMKDYKTAGVAPITNVFESVQNQSSER